MKGDQICTYPLITVDAHMQLWYYLSGGGVCQHDNKLLWVNSWRSSRMPDLDKLKCQPNWQIKLGSKVFSLSAPYLCLLWQQRWQFRQPRLNLLLWRDPKLDTGQMGSAPQLSSYINRFWDPRYEWYCCLQLTEDTFLKGEMQVPKPSYRGRPLRT